MADNNQENKVEQSEQNQPKFKKALKVTGFVIYGLLLLIMLTWGIFAQVYKNRYFPNVYVLGVNVGGLNKNQAQKEIGKKIQEIKTQEVVLKIDSSQTTAKLEDTGAEIYADDVLIEISKYGRDRNVLKQFSELVKLVKKVNVDPKMEINQTQFDAFFNDFVQNNTHGVVQPKLSVSNGRVAIIPGSEGVVINQDKLKSDLADRISNDSKVVISVETEHVQPEDTNSSKYQNAKSTAESMIGKNITLNYNGQSFFITPAIVSSWILFDQSKNPIAVNYSDASVYSWVSTLSIKIDVAPVPTVLNYKGELVSEGKEGIAMDRDGAYNQIRSILRSSSKNGSFDIGTGPVAPPVQRQTSEEGPNAGMAEGKYIEIDISQQRMYLFDGTSLANTFVVSTGKSTMPTPYGEFTVLNKNPRAYSAKYGLYMPWWMAFTNQGHGIHELPEWPNGAKEGESHLGIRVSHGCVRLGVGPAEYVYGWTPVGTQVFIHG